MEEDEIGRFAEDTVNNIIKKLQKLNISEKPTKIKLSMEFGENGPRFTYMAKATRAVNPPIFNKFQKVNEEKHSAHFDMIEHKNGITVLIELSTQEKQIGVEAVGSTMFINFGANKQVVRLPREIDAQGAHAVINNNVLEVNLPYGKTDKITKIDMVDRDAKKSY